MTVEELPLPEKLQPDSDKVLHNSTLARGVLVYEINNQQESGEQVKNYHDQLDSIIKTKGELNNTLGPDLEGMRTQYWLSRAGLGINLEINQLKTEQKKNKTVQTTYKTRYEIEFRNNKWELRTTSSATLREDKGFPQSIKSKPAPNINEVIAKLQAQ